MPDADPFKALGLAPTLDRDAIKRAYFEAVRRNPPHTSPEAFRTVRSAYEQLSDGPELVRAWLTAPVDEGRLLQRWNERFSARIEAACAGQQAPVDVARGFDLLIERCARTRIGA